MDPADLKLDGFSAHLGFTLTEVSGDAVRGFMEIGPEHHQPGGLVHGGVYSSVVELAASCGASVWFGDRGHVVGTSNQTDFIRGISEGTLAVEATPLHRGRSRQLWQVFITDQDSRLIAKGDVELANITGAS